MAPNPTGLGSLRGEEETQEPRHSKKAAFCKPGRGAPSETSPVSTLTLDFQPRELSENKYLLFKPSGLGYFVIAAN